MQNLKSYLTVTVCLLFSLLVNAQDAHFSQFYASPVNLNPAFTGVTNSKYRVATQIRNQGRSLNAPLSSYNVAFDMNMNRKTYTEFFWGGGIAIQKDISDASAYAYNQVLLSGAGHKVLDKQNMLSFGMQLGMGQMRFNDLSGRVFPSDIIPGGTAGVTDPDAFQRDMNIELNTGISYLGKISRHSVFAGFSAYNIIPSGKGERNLRYTGHGGFKFKIVDKFKLTPNFIYNAQNQFNELNIGTNFELNIPDNTYPELTASLGSYFRMNGGNGTGFDPNALIFIAGVSYNSVAVGISYDLNISDVRTISNGSQGLELSLVYEGMLYKSSKRRITIGCPKW